MFNRFRATWPKDYQGESLLKSHQNGVFNRRSGGSFLGFRADSLL